MDRLLVMRSLVTVATTESFAGAAEEMRTSASSISRHVASLEKHLGVRLVNRTARSVTLTDDGLRYTEFARRILDEVDEEDRRLAGRHRSIAGPLSVVCPKWLGGLDLGDAIAHFAARHPEIEVRLELGGVQDRSYAFLESGFDVSFHSRPLRDSRMRLRRVATLPFVLCAAPPYLDERGRPAQPEDLLSHETLTHEHETSWRLDVDGGQAIHRFPHSAFTSNSYVALQKAAVAGRGVALLPLRLTHASLEAGELEPLLGGAIVQQRTLAAVHGPGRTPGKVTALLDFVSQWFSDHPTPTVPAPVG